VECRDSKFLSGGVCVDACPAGYFGMGTGTTGRMCQACEAHCAACNGSRVCAECRDTMPLSSSHCANTSMATDCGTYGHGTIDISNALCVYRDNYTEEGDFVRNGEGCCWGCTWPSRVAPNGRSCEYDSATVVLTAVGLLLSVCCVGQAHISTVPLRVTFMDLVLGGQRTQRLCAQRYYRVCVQCHKDVLLTKLNRFEPPQCKACISVTGTPSPSVDNGIEIGTEPQVETFA